jgi:hypothetical protein
MPEELKPWDRRPDESVQAYRALKSYLEMGDRRSLVAVAHNQKKSSQQMSIWSSKHDWVARCVDYDGHMGRLELERKEKVRAEYAEKSERRRLETAEASWDLGTRLFLKAQKMLEAPLYTEEITQEKYEDGRAKTTIVMIPAGWNAKTAAMFAKAASDLCQIALFQMKFAEDDFDPTKASPDQLRAYLQAHGVKQLPGPSTPEEESE